MLWRSPGSAGWRPAPGAPVLPGYIETGAAWRAEAAGGIRARLIRLGKIQE
jgi:hypothetical protein